MTTEHKKIREEHYGIFENKFLEEKFDGGITRLNINEMEEMDDTCEGWMRGGWYHEGRMIQMRVHEGRIKWGLDDIMREESMIQKWVEWYYDGIIYMIQMREGY